MVRPCHYVPSNRIVALLLFTASLLPGCGVVPRSRMDECQKLSQLLRTENARLKDRMLALQSQNRDYADRAVDDLRRLTARERAMERLEADIRAYQEDRERLATAYEQLRSSLGRQPAVEHPISGSDVSQHDSRRRATDQVSAPVASRPKPILSPDDGEISPEPAPRPAGETGP